MNKLDNISFLCEDFLEKNAATSYYKHFKPLVETANRTKLNGRKDLQGSGMIPEVFYNAIKPVGNGTLAGDRVALENVMKNRYNTLKNHDKWYNQGINVKSMQSAKAHNKLDNILGRFGGTDNRPITTSNYYKSLDFVKSMPKPNGTLPYASQATPQIPPTVYGTNKQSPLVRIVNTYL